MSKKKRSVIYENYVECFIDVDKNLQHLKHNHFRITLVALAFKSKIFVSTNIKSTFIFVFVFVFVVVVVFLIVDDSINLNFVVIVVKSKFFVISKVREICNKWHLCYYCKNFHKKIAKNCFNKKKFFNFRIVKIDDIVNVDNDISVFLKKI